MKTRSAAGRMLRARSPGAGEARVVAVVVEVQVLVAHADLDGARARAGTAASARSAPSWRRRSAAGSRTRPSRARPGRAGRRTSSPGRALLAPLQVLGLEPDRARRVLEVGAQPPARPVDEMAVVELEARGARALHALRDADRPTGPRRRRPCEKDAPRSSAFASSKVEPRRAGPVGARRRGAGVAAEEPDLVARGDPRSPCTITPQSRVGPDGVREQRPLDEVGTRGRGQELGAHRQLEVAAADAERVVELQVRVEVLQLVAVVAAGRRRARTRAACTRARSRCAGGAARSSRRAGCPCPRRPPPSPGTTGSRPGCSRRARNGSRPSTISTCGPAARAGIERPSASGGREHGGSSVHARSLPSAAQPTSEGSGDRSGFVAAGCSSACRPASAPSMRSRHLSWSSASHSAPSGPTATPSCCRPGHGHLGLHVAVRADHEQQVLLVREDQQPVDLARVREVGDVAASGQRPAAR